MRCRVEKNVLGFLCVFLCDLCASAVNRHSPLLNPSTQRRRDRKGKRREGKRELGSVVDAGAAIHDAGFGSLHIRQVAPGGIGFVTGRGLGPQYDGDLIVGAATPSLAGGYLFRFNLTGNRLKIGADDPRLEDRVAENTAKFDATESESLMFGRDFGVSTDIRTGPNGNLFVVSLSKGSVFEIYSSKYLVRNYRTVTVPETRIFSAISGGIWPLRSKRPSASTLASEPLKST
jgi:hypothetical protein